METPSHFPASLDMLGLAISAVTALLIGSGVYTLYSQRELLGIGTWLIASVVFGSLLVGWLMRPTGYTLTEDELIIRRAIGPRNLALEDIGSAKRVTEADMGSQIRLFGSGGFGGYFGLYKSSVFGRLDYYATNLSNLVLIEPRGGQSLVVSPDDPSAFVAALQARLTRDSPGR